MKILSKYLTREFLKLLCLCQIVFLSIYLIIDFLQKIDNLIEADVSKGIMLAYFLYKTPFVIVQMLPPATLISVIIMFSLLKKKNELTAMKACGLNIFRVTQSIVVVSILMGIVLFLFSEIVVPYSSSKFNEIWDIEVEKRDPTQFYGMNQIWYKGSGSIYWMRRFDYDNRIMERPTFYFFDKSFRLIKRIDGRRAVWEKSKWKVEEGVVQEVTDDGGYRPTKFTDLYLKIEETPETFVRRVKSPEEMSYWQLKRYAKRVLTEGYDNTEYLVDMNFKIAFPFIILIMVLIGMPISLKVEKGGVPFAIFMGMCLCFLYMVAFGFTRSLGLSGALPPILSAWLANLIFLFLSIYLLMKVER
ncbi:MAG: LPS export ABC transporter permease LptG [Deltaproteobacteria bacterium]|nr:MAG: LPS export ABC transporter permease LptG [Deltaproteobacteria bacterium]